jgi:hypothetical protein
MNYYLDDNDWVYAIDKDGKQYAFNAKTKKLEERPNCVDIMWGGCTEEYAKQRMAEIAAA